MTTDPTALAREVLDDELGWEVKPGDLMHPEDKAATYRLANAAPVLARAVIELTAERDAYREGNMRLREMRARTKALADLLARQAAWERNPPAGTMPDTASLYADGLEEAAARIRAALNGDNK